MLFGGAQDLQAFLVNKVAEASTALASIEAVATAFDMAGIIIPERRAYARQRQRILAANTELQERELMKLASLSAALAGLFRERGVSEMKATLTAEAGVAVFMVAFRQWIAEHNEQSFAELTQRALREWRNVIASRENE